MRSISHRGCNSKTARIMRIVYFLVLVQVLCIFAGTWVYYVDHRADDVLALKIYLYNYGEIVYNDRDMLDISEVNSLSGLITKHNVFTVEENILGLVDDSCKNVDISGDELFDSLTNCVLYNVDVSSFIRCYILSSASCNMINLSRNDSECLDGFRRLAMYRPGTVRTVRGLLIVNSVRIYGCLTGFILLSFNASIILSVYAAISSLKKRG